MTKQLKQADVIVKDQAYMEFPLQIKRQYGAPLDGNEIWYDLEALKEFAKSGATKYIGETVKYVDEVHKTVTSYKIGFGGTLLQDGTSEHVHTADEITETETKKFVSKTEKDRWNDTYTKAQTDEKIKGVTTGLAFKGTFNTLADLPSVEEAQDGWFAIVINEPTAKGENVLVIFESSTKEWKQLGGMLTPGIATEDTNGLMTKEMVKALNKAGVDIAGLKNGSLLPKATSTQLGVVKQGANITIAEDGTISTHAPYQHPAKHAATEITEDTAHRFVSDADKASYADKYTKTETQGKISEAITASEGKITEAYKAADVVVEGKITALGTAVRGEFAAADTALEKKITTAYTAADTALEGKITKAYQAADTVLDNKIKAVDAKIVSATEDDINALFA